MMFLCKKKCTNKNQSGWKHKKIFVIDLKFLVSSQLSIIFMVIVTYTSHAFVLAQEVHLLIYVHCDGGLYSFIRQKERLSYCSE
jgi:hypothetical protein